MSINNRTKLRDFIQSVPILCLTQASLAVLGSLAMTCTDEDMDGAIAAAKKEIQATNTGKEA